MTDKLTVTLGARYEHSIAPKPTFVNPDWPETATIHTGAMNLAPRVGIAYRIDNKTVVRGGFGTYFARLLSGMVEDTLEGQGLFQQAVSLTGTNASQLAGGPSLPNTLSAPPSGLTPPTLALQFTAPGLKTPYSEQASLAVERQIGKDMVLTVSGPVEPRCEFVRHLRSERASADHDDHLKVRLCDGDESGRVVHDAGVSESAAEHQVRRGL